MIAMDTRNSVLKILFLMRNQSTRCVEQIGFASLDRHRLSFLFSIIVMIAGTILLLRPMVNPDIWFHMTVGREVFRLGSVPPTEFYVLPLIGEPGSFHEWGFGLLYFLVEKQFGVVALSWLNALIGAGTATALFVATVTRVGHSNRLLAFIAVISITMLFEFRMVYRPETFLYLSIACELAILEIYAARKTARVLLLLPLIAWVLAQCHPSSIFLVIILIPYMIQSILVERSINRTFITLALTGCACLLTSTINPYGLAQLLLPFKFQAEAELLESLSEFLPAWKTPYQWHFALATFLALISGIFAIKQRRWADIVLLLLFGVLAWLYVRNIAIFALVLALPLASSLIRIREAANHLPMALWSIPIAIGAVIVQTVGFIEWGIGTKPSPLPEKAAEKIADYGRSVRVINFFHLGNYLAWASKNTLVLVDGRNFGNNRAVSMHDFIMLAAPGWEKLVRSVGAEVIVTPATLPFSGQMIPLVAALENHPNWRLVSREPAALTFTWEPGHSKNAVIPASEIWLQAIEEANTTLRDNPNAESASETLATAQQKLGRLK